MMAKVLAALCLVGTAVGESAQSGATCGSGEIGGVCTDSGDKGMTLLQRKEGLGKVVLDTSSLEDPPRPLVRLMHSVNVTLDAKPGPLPLCHPAIVKRTCRLMNEGVKGAENITMEQVQEVLSVNDTAVARLWDALKLAALGDTVTCEALCSSLVDYIRVVGILPPSSDRACVTSGGQTKCDLDVSPQKLVRDMATTENLQPDQDVQIDQATLPSQDAGQPAFPAGLVQHVVEMSAGSPRMVRRGLAAEGSAPSGTLFQDHESSEVKDGEATMPEFCPLSLWETVEMLANFFRIFPSRGASPVVSSPDGPSLAQGGGEAMTASGSTISQVIAENNAQAKAWVSTVSVELAQGRTAAHRQTWFGGSGTQTQSQIRSRLIKVMSFIEKELDTMHYVYPADQAVDTACNGNVAAYVWKANSNYQGYEETKSPMCTSGSPMSKHCAVDGQGRYYVYLCQRWSGDPQVWRTSTLVHEAAHHTGPGDQSYDIPTMQGFSQSKQLDNAANYQHFAQQVASAAYGCSDNNPPNVGFSCNPGPCTCSALSAYCQDPTYGPTIRDQCGASCGSCGGSGAPAPAPPPPPPSSPPSPPSPPPAGSCVDTQGRFTVTIGGQSYTANCKNFAAGGGCPYDKVSSKCPASCGVCSTSPGCYDDPNYSIQTQIGTLTCNDWKQYQCWAEVEPHCPVSCSVPGCTR